MQTIHDFGGLRVWKESNLLYIEVVTEDKRLLIFLTRKEQKEFKKIINELIEE